MVTFMYCLGIIAEYNILISHIYNFIFIWSQPPPAIKWKNHALILSNNKLKQLLIKTN